MRHQSLWVRYRLFRMNDSWLIENFCVDWLSWSSCSCWSVRRRPLSSNWHSAALTSSNPTHTAWERESTREYLTEVELKQFINQLISRLSENEWATILVIYFSLHIKNAKILCFQLLKYEYMNVGFLHLLWQLTNVFGIWIAGRTKQEI